MMYTEWGVTYDVYRMRCDTWCIQNEVWHMMYTEWGVTYDVDRMWCGFINNNNTYIQSIINK